MNSKLARNLARRRLTLVLMAVTVASAVFDPHGFWYWLTVPIYVVQVTYSLYYFWNHDPSWRRTDSRKTDGDRRA